jgi:hypothetical protein
MGQITSRVVESRMEGGKLKEKNDKDAFELPGKWMKALG